MPHSLGVVTAEQAEPQDEVLVSPDVIAKMRTLPRTVAAAVADTILRIPSSSGHPFRFEVPGDPPDTKYQALAPKMEQAPAVIYRATMGDEHGRWLVTALLDRAAYNAYTGRLADNSFVQGLASAVAVGGTISATGDAFSGRNNRQ